MCQFSDAFLLRLSMYNIWNIPGNCRILQYYDVHIVARNQGRKFVLWERRTSYRYRVLT
jgi:hypothetical protein